MGGWHVGCGSGYEIEQTTFSFSLWRAIRHDFDVLHVQDPWIARHLDLLHRVGLSRARVILANGTGESDSFLRHIRNIQRLTPAGSGSNARLGRREFTIPNFVDVETFRPGDKARARAALKLPADRMIVFSASALRKRHKRVDYLIREFKEFRDRLAGRTLLLLAGAKEAETEEVTQMAASLLSDDVRILLNVDRARMPVLYQAADVFAIASLYEMFGIVLLEAMATGLPVIANDTPEFRWLTGPAGCLANLQSEGALARELRRLADDANRRESSQHARSHILLNFSEEVVVDQVLDMYRQVSSHK